jgi:hypothetical protein
MSFEYRHTCPIIDSGIERLKHDIESSIITMLDECCPMLIDDQKASFVSTWVNVFYADLECAFEDVRRTNQDMRQSAEHQIDLLKNEISDLENDIERLTQKISEQEEELNEHFETK